MASRSRYSVIIFVMLAIGSLLSAFLLYKIFPDEASIIIAADALTSIGSLPVPPL